MAKPAFIELVSGERIWEKFRARGKTVGMMFWQQSMGEAVDLVVTPAPNAAPAINGSPAGSLDVNTAYSFRPNASDADGDALTFAISGKPSWAAFDASTGSLSGTPIAGQAGTYGNIVIRVSDGRATTTGAVTGDR